MPDPNHTLDERREQRDQIREAQERFVSSAAPIIALCMPWLQMQRGFLRAFASICNALAENIETVSRQTEGASDTGMQRH